MISLPSSIPFYFKCYVRNGNCIPSFFSKIYIQHNDDSLCFMVIQGEKLNEKLLVPICNSRSSRCLPKMARELKEELRVQQFSLHCSRVVIAIISDIIIFNLSLSSVLGELSFCFFCRLFLSPKYFLPYFLLLFCLFKFR